MTEREAYIALNLINDLGPVRVRSLIDTLGSPQAILTAAEQDLVKAPKVGPELAKKIAAQSSTVDPHEEINKAKKHGARVLTPLDDEYPASLKEIHDPPLALYAMGSFEKADRRSIGVVGSRRCTHYGRQTADRLGYQLAQAGFTVTSGLARGIDTAAHQGALKAKGRTIAVLGSALDTLYPPENAELAERIAEQGAVISEYPMGKQPDRTTFPYRNRVISGISMGVVIVEAPPKSGALHTADAALNQGRSVFAVPGRIDSNASRGSNRLIKAGARLVEDIDDILQEFEFLVPEKKQAPGTEVQPEFQLSLSDDEQKIVEVLVEGETDVDSLTRKAGLASARISSLLLGLEMKRVVKILPGRLVALTVEIQKPETEERAEG